MEKKELVTLKVETVNDCVEQVYQDLLNDTYTGLNKIIKGVGVIKDRMKAFNRFLSDNLAEESIDDKWKKYDIKDLSFKIKKMYEDALILMRDGAEKILFSIRLTEDEEKDMEGYILYCAKKIDGNEMEEMARERQKRIMSEILTKQKEANTISKV